MEAGLRAITNLVKSKSPKIYLGLFIHSLFEKVNYFFLEAPLEPPFDAPLEAPLDALFEPPLDAPFEAPLDALFPADFFAVAIV